MTCWMIFQPSGVPVIFNQQLYACCLINKNE